MANTDKLKKLLREEGSMPPELAWDQVGDSIMHGLDRPSSDDRKRRGLLFIPLLLMGASIVLYVLLYNFRGSASINSDREVIAETTKTPLEQPNKTNPDQYSSSSSHFKSKRFIADSSDRAIERDNIQSRADANRPDDDQGLIRSDGKSSSPAIDKYEESVSIMTTQSNAEHRNFAASAGSEESSEVENYTSSPIPSTRRLVFPYLSRVATVPQASKSYKLDVCTELTPLDIEPLVSTGFKQALSISVGVNRWMRGSEISDAERPLVGRGLSLTYDRFLSQRWSLSMGLKIRQLYSRLDYYDDRATQVSVIQYHTNTLTGLTDSISIMADAYQFRQIRHLNRTTTLSIPLALRYHGQINSLLSWNVGSGVEYFLAAEQKGKYLIDNLASDGFRTAGLLEEGPYTITGAWMFKGLVGLDYALTPQVDASLSLAVSQGATSWSTPAISRPLITDVSLGLRYRW